MADLYGFNAQQVEPARASGEPIPAGQYVAMIISSEMKPTKAGNGSYLQLAFEIIEGPHARRQAWARLNLENANATAVQIAQSQLSAICHAVGVLQPRDSVDLHNLPLVISVKCRKRQDTGEIVNEIGGFAKREQPAVQPASQAISAASAPAPLATTPPWKRG
jgi:hypothetical protein